jgi:hypothetical protein
VLVSLSTTRIFPVTVAVCIVLEDTDGTDVVLPRVSSPISNASGGGVLDEDTLAPGVEAALLSIA